MIINSIEVTSAQMTLYARKELDGFEISVTIDGVVRIFKFSNMQIDTFKEFLEKIRLPI